MSSTSGLSRTKSLRKPANHLENSKDLRPTRIASPTRIKPPSSSSSTTTTTTTASSALAAPSRTASSSVAGAATKTRTSRPLSGISAGLGRVFSGAKEKSGLSKTATVGGGTETARPTTSGGLAGGRKSRSHTTTTGSTLPGTSSLARPKTSGGLGLAGNSATGPATGGSAAGTRTRAQTHTRTKSSGLGLGNKPLIPPPSPSKSGHMRPVSVQSSTSSGSGPLSGKTRTGSTTTPTTTAATATHRRQPSFSSSSAAAGAGHAGAPHGIARPAFSTLQQHYSPAKNIAPKPSTASYLAPPSPSKLPANVAATAETSRLQSELLQLCLLHGEAEGVYGEWKVSAKTRLGERFAKVGRWNGEVGGAEREVVEGGNVGVLKGWFAHTAGDAGNSNGGGGGGGGVLAGKGRARAASRAVGNVMEEKIQAVDAVVTGLWTMGETGGKYSRVVRRFERWVVSAGEAVDMRARTRCGNGLVALLDAHPETNDGDGPAADDGLFVGGLDDRWKEECAGLYRKLDGWRRVLREVTPAGWEVESARDRENRGRNALARTLAGCRELVHDMLAELDAMEKIEREAVAAENEWVRKVNREEEDGGQDGGQDGGRRRAGAIWRAT